MCILLNGLDPVCQCIRIDLLCFRHRRAAQCEIDDPCCKTEKKKLNKNAQNSFIEQSALGILRVRVRIYESLISRNNVRL